jgi:hypothetical protein
MVQTPFPHRDRDAVPVMLPDRKGVSDAAIADICAGRSRTILLEESAAMIRESTHFSKRQNQTKQYKRIRLWPSEC